MIGDGRQPEWSKITEAEIRKIKRQDCSNCGYSAIIFNTSKINGSKILTCMYICHTGKRRPCRPGECKKKGVYKPKRRRRTGGDADGQSK